MANLLSLAQDVADRVGLVRPTVVIGNSDAQVRNVLACAQQEGREQARRTGWQAITKEKTFTTIAQESQTGALPTDFDRFVPGTFYNRTRSRIVTGPLTAQEYADYKGRLTSIVYEAFRVRGDAILLLPTPTAGETMAFEYVSKWWAGTASDTAPTLEQFAADTDENFLDDELFRLGMVWRFKKSRGLDYGEDHQSYEMHLAQVMGRDGGTRTLNMGGRVDRRVPRAPQAPDGNWNIS
jgi:hypothetical protein